MFKDTISLSLFVLLTFLTFVHSYKPSSKISFENLGKIFPLSFFDPDELETFLNEGTWGVPEEDISNFELFYDKEEETVVPRVTIPDFGTARGRVLTSFFGRKFFAFHSIPYAKPPEGDLRFRMPQPFEGEWDKDIEDDYDATFIRAKCPQESMILPIPGGRENCLHINIYTPDTILDKPEIVYPVMFYIHGGSFLTGDATLYVPTKLMDRDVIVVMVQYRLGSLGFLASGTPDNPGNMGLMDQIMALRWVQDYISYFGGNSSLVTVFGQSAGAASASWMLFSPLVKNDGHESQLLHRVIMESGSALEAWAHDPDPQGSFILEAKAVDCWNDTTEDPVADALSCMRSLTMEEIVKGCLDVYTEDRMSGGLGFKGASPVIQSDLVENYPEEIANDPDLLVISSHPLKLIKEGEFLRVPIMAGSVRDEGSLVLGLTYRDFLTPNNLTDNSTFLANEGIAVFVNAFGIDDTTGSVTNSLRLAFLKNAEMGDWDSMSGGLVDMSGMLFLKSGMWTFTQLLTYKNPKDDIFFYSFEFESDDSIFDWYFMSMPDIPIKGGITHADELPYLFHLPSLMVGDERQQTTVKRLTKLWTNFAKYGNPTPDGVEEGEDWHNDVAKWKPFTIDTLDFMLMSDEFTMEKDFTLRWNYNMLAESPSCPSPSPPVKQAMESELREAENSESSNEEVRGWKVAVAALMSCCVLLIFSVFILLLRLRI